MPPPRGTPNVLEGPADYDMTSQVHSDSYAAIDPLNADFTGKAVFITGASRGLGADIAKSFARAGASSIALGARTGLEATVSTILEAAQAAGRPEPQVLPVKIDISNPASVEAAAAEIKARFGRLDVVVNNAGVFNDGGSILTASDPDAWFSNYEINLKGPYLILRSFIPLLLETEGGDKTVVTVSSVGAFVSTPGMSGYQSSKWAVLKLADHALAEFGDKGLVTYNIHPGNIPTTMLGDAPLADHLVPVFVDTAKLVGDSLVYLTSEKRDWLGGRYINLTWDLPELMGKKDEIVSRDMLKVKLVV